LAFSFSWAHRLGRIGAFNRLNAGHLIG
jgi:hypothetical protein